MSKEKLTIEHLAPYLPYGVKYIDKDSEKAETMRSICTEIDLIDFGWGNAHELNEFKPILRPLSDLTKEIEHNGEKFIPWRELEFGIDKDLDIEIIVGDSEYLYIPYIELRNEMQKLFKWHFDVFGLIDKGLALNLNDLKDE